MSGADSGFAGTWITLLTLTLLVVLVALVVRLIRRGTLVQGAASDIQVVAMRSIGPREQVLVVRIQDRYFALGHTPSHISMLSELDDYNPNRAASQPVPPGLADQFRQLLNKGRH